MEAVTQRSRSTSFSSGMVRERANARFYTSKRDNRDLKKNRREEERREDDRIHLYAIAMQLPENLPRADDCRDNAGIRCMEGIVDLVRWGMKTNRCD